MHPEKILQELILRVEFKSMCCQLKSKFVSFISESFDSFKEDLASHLIRPAY